MLLTARPTTWVVFRPLGSIRMQSPSVMSTETPKSKLDAFEALVERYEFCLSHKLLELDKIPTDHLHKYSSLEQSLANEEKKHLKNLRKRFSKLFFSEPKNRNIKKFLAFRYSALYRKTSSVVLYSRRKK